MPAPRRLRAALYHRVSTCEQNPRLARVELRAAAATRGLRVVLEVEETASGRGSVRPGFEALMDGTRSRRQLEQLEGMLATLCTSIDGF